MTGGKKGSRFIQQLRMKRALGIKSSCRMWPGRDRRRGFWWDRKLNCIAIEGKDFAQDTQEGGADRFELIPDSDEEGGAKGSSLLIDDDEYVPETEPQDAVTVSKIAGPCANKVHQRLRGSALLHEWRQIIADMENESGKVQMESSKVQMDSIKLEKERGKVEMVSKITGSSANQGRQRLGSMLHEWRRIIADMENESGNVQMESSKVQMDSIKSEKEEVDHMASFSDIETDDEAYPLQDWVDNVKLKESGRVEMQSKKLEMCAKVHVENLKLEKELDHMASFSDIETDDEAYMQDGVDLRGYSQDGCLSDQLPQVQLQPLHLPQDQDSLHFQLRMETKLIISLNFSCSHYIFHRMGISFIFIKPLVEIRHLISFLLR